MPSSQPSTSRILPIELTQGQRTVMGIGVPVAPSFLDLEDEETIAYKSDVPAVSLPALLKQCARKSAPADSEKAESAPTTPSSEIRPREASFHTVPNFPSDSSPEIILGAAESNLHEVDGERITDSLVSPASGPAAVVHVPAAADPAPDEWIRLRVGAPSEPPLAIAIVPSRRPSARRSFWTKLLFAMIAMTVALIATSELAAAGKIPRGLDPRPVLTKGARLALDKVPWERVRRLSGH
jgi:hypothetical protein